MKPLQLGQCVSTPAALAVLQEAGVDPASLLFRQQHHDWGTLDSHDRQANADALRTGARVFSVYILPATNATIWCITEGTNDQGERESTCLLTPADY